MPLVLTPIGSSLFVVDAVAGITLEFARLVDHKDTLTAEVTITSLGAGEVAWSRINLTSVQGRNTLSKAANDQSPEAPWPDLVNAACRLVAKHLRAGEPAVAIVPAEPNGHRYLVPDYIPRGQITVLYADGDTGKSLLALAIAVAGLQGHPLSRRWPVGDMRRALYLDWESDRQTVNERAWGLTQGREQLAPDAILHRRLYRPLTDHLDAVKGDVDRHGIDFVIVDSLAPAAGLEPEGGDAAVRTFAALGSLLPATILVIAHVSKAAADEQGPARPYGSVFVRNLARSLVEARRQDSADGDRRLVVNLYHRKSNLGVRAKASALAFDFDASGGIAISGAEVDMARAGLPDRILDAMREGAETVTAISEAIESTPESVRRTLHRLENRDKVVRLTVTDGGRSKNTQWGLRVANRDTLGD